MTDKRMTKSEREDLQRLVRQREKVQKSAAKARSTELLADFENQIAAEYRFDDDAVWAAAAKAADAEVAKAQDVSRSAAKNWGFRNSSGRLLFHWVHRGYDNTLEKRRAELRRVAQEQVESLEQQAIVKIEPASVEAQTQIAVAGLTSEAAHSFLASLPTVESLMPALTYRELAGEADPPIVEQLITPNALRQRRFRERQKALRDANVTVDNALPDDLGGINRNWKKGDPK